METHVRKLVGTLTVFGGLRTYDFDSAMGLQIDLTSEKLTLHGLTDTEAFRLLQLIDGIQDPRDKKPPASTPANGGSQAAEPADEPAPTPVEIYASGDKQGAAEAERESVKPPTTEAPTKDVAQLTKAVFFEHVKAAKSAREIVLFLVDHGYDEPKILKLLEKHKDLNPKLAAVKDLAKRVRDVLKAVG